MYIYYLSTYVIKVRRTDSNLSNWTEDCDNSCGAYQTPVALCWVYNDVCYIARVN